MRSAKTLLFFTLQYPYGQKSETFIENEINYLSESFDRIIIFPREKHGPERRDLPENVEVDDLLVNNEKIDNRFKYMFGSFQRFMSVIRIYGYTLFYDKKRIHYVKGGYFIYYLTNALNDAEAIGKHLQDYNLDDIVIYDYWFVNSTLSLAYLKNRNKIKEFYCRAHGFDVFDERWSSGSVPFRAYILKHVNSVLAISDFNRNYIVKQLNRYGSKVKVAYLGVKNNAPVAIDKNETTNNDVFLIVSCANLFPFKQTKKIVEVLKLLNPEKKRVKWVHFGDGEEETALLEAAKLLPKTIFFDYRGHVRNSEVIAFYANNSVDLFMSLSLKEGLPVSMMEAQSFGIPILAYNIFGIPEIVTATTGVLLQATAANEDISKIIDQLMKNQITFDRMKIRQFFAEHFSAEKNYNNFIESLLSND